MLLATSKGPTKHPVNKTSAGTRITVSLPRSEITW